MVSCLFSFFLSFSYFLRATIGRRLNDISKEMDIVVHTLSTYPELNSSIKMEVGIEDCLHIEFEYNKSKYDFLYTIIHSNNSELVLLYPYPGNWESVWL